MNMISTGAFLVETDASTKQNELVKKLTAAWEKKNSKTARAGGASLMALSLAACGGEDDTPFSQADVDAAVAAVDITTDNQAAIDAAIAALPADTTPFSQADIDAAVAAVDITTDNAAATDAAVAAATSFASLDGLVAAYNNLETAAAQPAELTTSAGDYVQLGAGDNTIVAVQTGAAATETFSATDTIDAGAGNDTIIITHEEAGVALNAAQVDGVESIVYRDVSGGGDLDMANFADATSLSLERMQGASDVAGLATTDTVSITDAGATYDATLTYTAAGVTGDADSASISVDGVTAGADLAFVGAVETMTVNVVGDASSFADLQFDAGTTTVNINAAANLTVATTYDAAGSTALNITGAGDVSIGQALDAATITVDASASTGDVTVTAGAVAEATDPSTVDIADITVTTGSGDDAVDVTNVVTARELSVSTGAGDDTVTIGTALVTSGATIAGDVIDGGEGTDILSMTSAIANGQATAVTTVSGFEEITISNALAANFTAANFQAGLNTINLAAGGAGTITLEAGSNTINLQDQLGGGLGATDTGTATTDSITIVNEDAAADAFNGQAITSTGFETVNIVTTGTGAATAQSIGAISVTADTGGTATVAVSGSNIANLDGNITADVLDLSGLTAQAAGTATADMTGVRLVATAGETGTITGSAGDDVLLGDANDTTNIDGGAGDDNITGGSDAETLNGGAGDDTIAGGGGADTINGGAGDDSITMAGTTESVDGGDGDDTVVAAGNLTFGTTVAGGAGTDILSVNDAVTAAEGSVVSGFETLVIATAGGGRTVDLANFGNNTFTTVQVDDGTNAIVVDSVAGQGITLGAAALGADLTVTLEDATGTADSQTITLSSAAAFDTTNDVLVAGVETINLVMTDTNATAHQNTLDLGADSATTINISGDAGVVFATGGNTDIADVQTMDASGVVLGAVTDSGVTYAATYNTTGGVTTLTGSNGVDSLTGGAATNDTINGGDGVDTIVYTGGTDNVTGGAGNDVFDVNAVGAAAGSLTIADIADGDTIDLVGAATGTIANVTAANWANAEVTLGASATLANYLDAAADQDGSTNSVLEWFTFGGNTYIVSSNDNGTTGGSAGFTAGTDLAIVLTGTLDISDSTVTSEVITIA